MSNSVKQMVLSDQALLVILISYSPLGKNWPWELILSEIDKLQYYVFGGWHMVRGHSQRFREQC